MLVDDRAQVAPHDDQVHAGVRARGRVLNDVSGFPFGCRITNETRTGLLGCTAAAGVKSMSAYVRAAWIVGRPDCDEPPHPAADHGERPRGRGGA